MNMSVSEVSKNYGVSVRTLHYYDEIGLLKPSQISEAGYRFYDENTLGTLNQILFLKELEFPLAQIKEIISHPEYDRQQALKNQRDLLILKRRRIDELLNLVESTIGGKQMSNPKITSQDIENAKQKYRDEVVTRWGNTEAFKQSEKMHSGYSAEKEAMLTEKAFEIISRFSFLLDKDPSDDAVQSLVSQWQNFITDNHYECTKEILSCLGLMYLQDERFRENIDRCGDGTAQFMSDAIAYYCGK